MTAGVAGHPIISLPRKVVGSGEGHRGHLSPAFDKGGLSHPNSSKCIQNRCGQSESFNNTAAQLLIMHGDFIGYNSVLIAYNWCSELFFIHTRRL